MAGSYIHWGVIQISVTNLVIIAAMIAVFALAIAVPFRPGDSDGDSLGDSHGDSGGHRDDRGRP